MSDAQKRKLQRDIETKGREAQRAVEDAEAAFQKEVQAFQQDVYNKARTIIHDHMLEKGYSLILDISNPQSPIVDAKTELLITNDIIEAYDLKHPASGAPAAAAAPSQD
jgi:outer membrane protein